VADDPEQLHHRRELAEGVEIHAHKPTLVYPLALA
jgi:hypothetical protein